MYSEEEIRRVETAIDRSNTVGKRDYAIVLLATRLGLRLEDIRTMSFDELDFKKETVHLIQEKTLAGLVLPMVPELKTALHDYIHNGRPDIAGSVFRISYPPYDPMTKSGVVACFRRALRKAGIERGTRGFGPRAFRSSLASSMVNALIANVLEYGKHGQPPKPFLKPAKAASRSACIEAMKNKFNDEINKI